MLKIPAFLNHSNSVERLRPQSKKQRIQEEVEEQNEAVAVEKPPAKIKIPAIERLNQKGRRRVFQRPPYGKDCMTTTDSEGRRVFMQLAQCEEEVVYANLCLFSSYLIKSV